MVEVLRFHRHGTYPAPYEGAATVVYSGEIVEIRGLAMLGVRFTTDHFRAVRAALAARGIKVMVWGRRVAGGPPRRVEVVL